VTGLLLKGGKPFFAPKQRSQVVQSCTHVLHSPARQNHFAPNWQAGFITSHRPAIAGRLFFLTIKTDGTDRPYERSLCAFQPALPCVLRNDESITTSWRKRRMPICREEGVS
jgi:hypothetical protein